MDETGGAALLIGRLNRGSTLMTDDAGETRGYRELAPGCTVHSAHRCDGANGTAAPQARTLSIPAIQMFMCCAN